MNITQAELFWLVGLLEGEGNFSYVKTQTIYIAMTDEDVIYKVADLFERVGNRACFVFTRQQSGNRKLQYCARVHGPEARAIMRLIVKHMGFRRRQKIWQCLNKHRGVVIAKSPYTYASSVTEPVVLLDRRDRQGAAA